MKIRMKYKLPYLLATLTLAITSHVTNATEWNFNSGKVKTGQLRVKNHLGQVKNYQVNTIGKNIASTPALIVADSSSSSGYSWEKAILLSNNNVYAYEGNFGIWLEMKKTDFDAKFTYKSTPVTRMSIYSNSNSQSNSITISGTCGNRQWNIDTGQDCTLTCNVPSHYNLIYSVSWPNYKQEYYDYGSCKSVSGNTEGSYAYYGTVYVYVSAETRVDYPINIGRGYYETSWGIGTQDHPGVDCCTAKVAGLNGTYTATI